VKMTFLHFVNCVALTFVPYFIVYRSTKLAEFRAFSICVWGGIAYILTQLAKMVFMATFLPSTDATVFDILQEIIKAVMNVGDVIGIHLVLNSISGYYGGDVRLLGVGLGWASAESVVMRLAPLWIGARNPEFDWSNIQTGIQANINLLLHISFVTAVWLWSRKKLDKKLTSFVVGIIIVSCVLPSFSNVLRVQLDSWIVLVINATISVSLAILSKLLYTSFSAQISKTK